MTPSTDKAATGATPSYSSSTVNQWGAVTLFHGLPSDHVRAIAQDSTGVMWFGTDSGLVKYDGRRIQRVGTEGLAAACVLALRFDQQGTLWIGTQVGAARLINGEFKGIDETQGSSVTAIITRDGRAVMATEQGEIFDCSTTRDASLAVRKIKPEDHPLLGIESRGHTPLQLTSLAFNGNTLIVGTRSRGLLAIDTSQMNAGTRTPDFITEILSRPRAFFVNALETDAHGQLWFGAETSAEDSGLYACRDLMRPEKIGAGTGTVSALAFDAPGNIWVGTEGRGVSVYRDGHRRDQFNFESTGGGLLSNHVYSIFIDREGVTWFGTNRGVCRYDPQAIRIEAVSTGPESNFVRALFQSTGGTLWCGTNRGLFVRDDETNWHEVKELKARVIHSIGEDNQGRLLVGTAGGLFAASKPSGQYRAAHQTLGFIRLDSANGSADNIRAIQTFRGVTYIANFGRGIERLDGSIRTLAWPDESADPRTRQVVSLHAEDDQLWIGTAEAGVFVFDGRQASTDNKLDELIGASVWSIDGAGNDLLWLATARGLYAFASAQLKRVIDNTDARFVIASKAGSSGRSAWCATVGGGLYKVRLDAGSAAASLLVSRFDTEQGLPSQNAFALALSSEASAGEALWIGTNRGLARYEPGRFVPGLSITRVMGARAYEPEELPRGLNLEYPQNSLAVDLAAISSRTFPEQFRYSFIVLDGNDRVITEKNSRESQLFIEGLKPGAYRVTARAFTSDLVASEPLQLSFQVGRAPFPWTSTALSMLLALALVAWWWGYRQNRRLRGANLQLAGTRLQLANETETERRRIARDLHDQTLADLRRLMMLTDQLPANENTNGHARPSQLRDEIESISTEIRRICEDLSPSALANVGLPAALEWALTDAVAQLPAEKKFEYEFECDAAIEERLRLEPSAQIQIYRIIQEALSNVCRHSGATRVSLSLAFDGAGDFAIELEDNGRGFDANKIGKDGRGLTNIRSRASLIGAEASWGERPAGGTLFRLLIAQKAQQVGQAISRTNQ